MRCLIFFLACLCPAAEYQIQRAASTIKIDARLDEPAWAAAPPTSDFIFNWFTAGEKETTEAKLLWDDDNLYVSWRCQDRHISAYVTERHGPVSKDDCVEVFISPDPRKVTNYYTWEINPIGAMLNRCRTDWWKGPPTWEPEQLSYRTTFHGLAKKDEDTNDREWIVELAIPFKNFMRDAVNTPPRPGDEWRLNLMRTGGKTNAQQSTWSPIAGEKRSFHTPENFGKVVFVAQQRGAGGRGARSRPALNPQQVEKGHTQYNRSCTVCHGVDGAAGDRAPALAAQRRYLRTSGADLFDSIKNGIKGTLMPATPMADEDVWNIVAYIQSLRATAADITVPGDLGNGRAVFTGKGGCTQCHMIRGRGGLVGPDLSDIGAQRKLEDIRAALMVPKPVPPRGYQPVSARTKAGAQIRGIVKNENNFSLQVLGLDDKLHLLTRDQLASITYEPLSLMPTNFDKMLTANEMQDLLAFLSKQARQRESK
ncbi:MAG: c-type cytochrome [Acidobacteriia bacterium]|nr:c-type cytochrome [Terriglobia bacterium]